MPEGYYLFKCSEGEKLIWVLRNGNNETDLGVVVDRNLKDFHEDVKGSSAEDFEAHFKDCKIKTNAHYKGYYKSVTCESVQNEKNEKIAVEIVFPVVVEEAISNGVKSKFAEMKKKYVTLRDEIDAWADNYKNDFKKEFPSSLIRVVDNVIFFGGKYDKEWNFEDDDVCRNAKTLFDYVRDMRASLGRLEVALKKETSKEEGWSRWPLTKYMDKIEDDIKLSDMDDMLKTFERGFNEALGDCEKTFNERKK